MWALGGTCPVWRLIRTCQTVPGVFSVRNQNLTEVCCKLLVCRYEKSICSPRKESAPGAKSPICDRVHCDRRPWGSFKRVRIQVVYADVLAFDKAEGSKGMWLRQE